MRSGTPSPPSCRSGLAMAGLRPMPEYRRCRSYALRRPPDEPVVERLIRAIDIRRIDPATAGLEYMHNAADHPSIINPRLAACVGRQKWGKPGKLIFCQPETIATH